MLTGSFPAAFLPIPLGTAGLWRPAAGPLTGGRLALGWLLTFVGLPLALLGGVFLFTLAAALPLGLLLGW